MGAERRYGEVYLITNKVNGKQYVGQTTKPVMKRFLDHVHASQGTRPNAVQMAIKEFGILNFEVSSVCTCFDRPELDRVERNLIQEYNSLVPYGYNLQLGGFAHGCHEQTKQKISKANKGKVRSEESKALMRQNRPPYVYNPETYQKVSQALTGQKRPLEVGRRISATQTGRKGKSPSKETRSAISRAHKGIKLTEEHKKNISMGHMGIVHSREVIENTAAKLRGRKQSQESVDKRVLSLIRPIVDSNGVIYPSIKEARRVLGIKGTSISAVLNGRQKSARGLNFIFFDPDNPLDIAPPPNRDRKPMTPENTKRLATLGRKPIVDQYGTVYESITAAAKAIGAHPKSISNAIHGLRNGIKGVFFKFVEKERSVGPS